MTKKLFLNAVLIDCVHAHPIYSGGMAVENGLITAVGNAADFPQSRANCEIIDCSGKTIMPGLINCHVHTFMEPYTWDRAACLQKPVSLLAGDMGENLKITLNSGVTCIRDLGCPYGLDLKMRDLIAEGKLAGPSMVCAGKPLTVTGGHGSDFSFECNGPRDFAKGAQEQICRGADLVKIMPTAGYARPKMHVNHALIEDTLCMSEDEIKAAVCTAHKMGKAVSAHCYGLIGVQTCVLNGVDTIEHGQLTDPGGDGAKKIADTMAERGTWLVPTLSAFFKEYDLDTVEEKYGAVIESFRLYRRAGVKIAMGTDAGVPWVGHDRAADEIAHMARYGMSTAEAITASTKSAAAMLGIEESYGTLEAGKRADFLVLDGDPVCDITALKRITSVFKHGELVKKHSRN